jgi:hypothetical protein
VEQTPHRLADAPVRSVSLGQRKWNGAYTYEQKQIKRASDEMRFDGGINLSLHLLNQWSHGSSFSFPRWIYQSVSD